MAGSRRRTLVRAVVAVLAVGWLATGIAGAYRYVHRYSVYRGFAPPVTPAGVPRGTVRDMSFFSRALGQRRRYLVYLPPRYAQQAARGRRFPVLYLLHGDPGQPKIFVDAGGLEVDANVLLARHRIRPMIIVMPQGRHSLLHGDTEWANTRSGRWEDLILETVNTVDHHFATLRDRAHRGLGGLSEGGFAALNIGLHHLSSFSVAESWSGYFRETPTGPFAGASRASLRANSPAAYVPAMAARIRRMGFRAWLYQGRSDPTAASLMTGFAAELHRAGAEVHYGFFRGGHDWGLWRRQLPHMLRVASDWFGRSPVGANAFTHVGHGMTAAQARQTLARDRRHCLRRHVRKGEHLGATCRAMRRAHGLSNPPTRHGRVI